MKSFTWLLTWRDLITKDYFHTLLNIWLERNHVKTLKNLFINIDKHMQTSAWFGLATLSKGHRLNTGRQEKTMTKNIGKFFERLNKVRIIPYAKSARNFFRLNYWTIEKNSVSLCWNDYKAIYWSQILVVADVLPVLFITSL